MNGILTLVTALFSFLSFGVILVLYWRDRRYLRSLAENLVGFFDVTVEGEGDEQRLVLDERVGAIIKALSSSLATSLKMSVLGSLSGQSRLDKGLKSAMAQDFIEKKAPILNLVGDVLGVNTSDYITDHPDAMMQLLPLFQRFFMGNSPSQGQYDPFK